MQIQGTQLLPASVMDVLSEAQIFVAEFGLMIQEGEIELTCNKKRRDAIREQYWSCLESLRSMLQFDPNKN